MRSPTAPGVDARPERWVFAGAAALLTLLAIGTRPPLRDPDSTLYAAMSSQLAQRPLSGWLTPAWPEGRLKSGPFLEHTAPSLWPGALLERMGVPGGAVVANLLCAVLLLWLVGQLARRLEPRGAVLAWASWGASIIGVQYWLRANHEIWWATAALGALLAIASGRPRWLAVGCIVLAVSIKGVLGLDTVLLALPLAWVLRGPRWAVLFAGFSGLASLAFVGLYELAYQAVTGQSFVQAYLSIQLGYVTQIEALGWGHKPLNVLLYLSKLLWFSLPGALLLGYTALRQRGWWREAKARPVLALLCGVLLVVLATSLMSRHAARYIFPCYPVLAVIGACAAGTTRLSGWLEGHGRWVLGAIVAAAAARLLFAQAVYREVNVLPGDSIQQVPRKPGGS